MVLDGNPYGESILDCPRCASELRRADVSGERLDVCKSCGGAFLAQRLLIPVLTALSRELARDLDIDTPLDPIEDRGAGIRCPRCSGPMENFGYMGADLVHLDRCDRCACIWADSGELGAATLLFARTNLRRDEALRRARDEFRQMSNRVDAVQVARATSRILFRLIR